MEAFRKSASLLVESFVKKGNWPYLRVRLPQSRSRRPPVVQAYGINRFSVAILVAGLVVMSILSVLFWKFQRDRSRPSLVVSLGLASFVIVLGRLIAFARVP